MEVCPDRRGEYATSAPPRETAAREIGGLFAIGSGYLSISSGGP
jgi:hypothetical protein